MLDYLVYFCTLRFVFDVSKIFTGEIEMGWEYYRERICQYCKQDDCSGSCEQYEEVIEIERQALEDDYHYGER